MSDIKIWSSTETKGYIDNAVTTVDNKLANYVPLAGGTMTGTLNVPVINSNTGSTAVSISTGTNSSSYFQSRKFRGEGTAATYYHAIDFGYASHNQVDFYEYGGTWNFWLNTTATATTATSNLALQINTTSLKNKTNTFTWPTKSGTFALVGDNLSTFTNDSGFITSTALDGYAKTADLSTVATSGSFSDLLNIPTTLAGYGITDVKIASGVITIGSNSITPLTTHQDISGKENISNKVTSISSSATDTQYASAKAIYDILPKVIR